MDTNKMKAQVTCTVDGKEVVEELEFTVIPPDKSKDYYGTGCYMTVKTPYDVKLIDVRYEVDTDVEILADRWMKNWYGDRATNIKRWFE